MSMKAKRKIGLLQCILLSMSLVNALAFCGTALAGEKPKVFFGGFAFSGNAGEVERNFPICSSLLEGGVDNSSRFIEMNTVEFFRKNRERFSKIDLQFEDVARREDSQLVMALAITDEKCFVRSSEASINW